MEHQPEHKHTQQLQQIIRVLMLIQQAQQHYNQIKQAAEFYISFGQSHSNYQETCDCFIRLLDQLDKGMEYGKTQLLMNSTNLCTTLENKDLQQRMDFIRANPFNELELNDLVHLIYQNSANNIPGMELFPGSGQFLPHAVAIEPLYVADKFPEILDNAVAVFNNDFYANRRVRKKLVTINDISGLPQGSLGIIYCFNEFFLANINYILAWAKQAHTMLYPGGKFIFNFLPDDEIWAQEQCLNHNFSVVNVKQLCTGLENIGYEIERCVIKELRRSHIVAIRTSEQEFPRLKVGASYAEIIDL
jgi:hypothetical protein